MNHPFYPIKFKPILKERIWGGNKLSTFLNKDTKSDNIGESWEISDVKNDTSEIVNGPLQGISLNELQTQLGPHLIGKKNFKIFKNKFPILIKFIDAKQDLSVQLHPNDKLAAERHNSFGKTEMWYIMQADKDSNLIVDFNQDMNKKKYLNHITNKSLPSILNYEKVKEGDTYFIEAGRVHAIGAGVLLAEIQQTSDITYRVFDWDREDDLGNSRELHNELAIDAIDFDMPKNYKVEYRRAKNTSNNIVKCPYFTTNYLDLNEPVKKINNYDSFIIYICVEGEAIIETETHAEQLKKGETILIPASIKDFSIVSNSSKLLEVYV